MNYYAWKRGALLNGYDIKNDGANNAIEKKIQIPRVILDLPANQYS
jgi:hypothetical protein